MSWLKAFAYFLTLAFMYFFSPILPLDPWGLFNIKKILSMILALSIIHFLGAVFIRNLGVKLGSLLSGFLGGFVSSTASTASLARKSKHLSNEEVEFEAISYLAATLAMLIEAMALVAIGSNKIPQQIYFIWGIPVVVTVILIIRRANKTINLITKKTHPELIDIGSTLKLTAFIFFLISISNLFQKLLGKSGLLVLTFIVSLFEIHGSIIANIDLHENGIIDAKILINLLCLSILASYLSKLFLIFSIGSSALKKIIGRWTIMILVPFLMSWIFAYYTLFNK